MRSTGKWLGIGGVIVVAAVLGIIFLPKGAPPEVPEIYHSDTYGFSFEVPESLRKEGYRVFESNFGVVAFEDASGKRLFEIHVYTRDEWEQVQALNEIPLKRGERTVFTYFDPSEALPASSAASIQKTFTVDN